MPGPIVPVPITAARRHLGHVLSLLQLLDSPPDALRRQRQLCHRDTPASATAVATAAVTAARAPFAAALRPVGPGPVLVLDDDAVHLVREILERRHAVVEQGLVQEQPVLVDHLLEERVAEPLQRAALVLALDELRVDRAPDVGARSPSCSTRTRPVSSSTATSAAPTHTSQKTGPSA